MQLLKMKGSRFWPKHKHWPARQRFCLVSGAPRSGTTAVLDWLDSLWEVAGFDESRILIAIHRLMEEIYRFKDLEKNKGHITDMARRLAYEYYCSQRILLKQNLIVNKEPLEPIAFPDKRYKAFLENVKILFPEAKFLFMIRDPVATVFSMRQRKWGYSLKEFEPRQTKIIGFSDEEREQILERSRPQLAALHAHGISDLT